jgi:hypothetical protein
MKSASTTTTYISIILSLVLAHTWAAVVSAEQENVIAIRDLAVDKACGPRCLQTLMKVTGKGQPGCGLECIYGLVDKSPMSPTSLYDLKVAAAKLGFAAEGRRMTLDDLADMHGYAILPVGTARGTADDPLHYILVVEGAEKGFIRRINGETLKADLIRTEDLAVSWHGYAILIQSALDGSSLPTEMDAISEPTDDTSSNGSAATKDFGPVECGSVLTHVFGGVGSGQAADCEHRISAKSCSCLEASIERGEDGKDNLTVEFTVQQHGWQTVYVRVLESPTGSTHTYMLRAYGLDSFLVTPKVGYLEVPNGGTAVYPVRVEYWSAADASVEYGRLESDIPNLTCRLTESKTGPENDVERSSALVMSLAYDATSEPDVASAVGRTLEGKIRFVLKTPKGIRVVPMKMAVKVRPAAAKAKVVPPRLFLFAPSEGRETHKKVAIRLSENCSLDADDVVVRSNGIVPIALRHSLTSDGILLEVAATGGTESLAKGIHRGRITVERKARAEGGTIADIPLTVYIPDR